MNKIIFADVDGVLNTWTSQRRLECCHEFSFVDTRKVLRLREIVERTGAQIVLSSSWRTGDHPKAFWYGHKHNGSNTRYYSFYTHLLVYNKCAI